MNTRGRLQEVERQHGHLSVLAVGSGEEAFAAVEDLVVGGVPVLHDLQAAVDLPAELLVCEGRAAPISRSPVQQANPGAERASWCRESNGWRHDHRWAPGPSERHPVIVVNGVANPAWPATGPGPFLLQSRV